MANAASRWDDTGSSTSWVQLEESSDLPPADLPLPTVREHQTTEAAQPSESGDQQGSTDQGQGGPAASAKKLLHRRLRSLKSMPSSQAAPVNQAAQGFLDHTHEPPVARRLRRQQEQAQRRGRRGIRWGAMGQANPAHNPLNQAPPECISQIGAGTDERSILILDGRDRRVQSPFQGWLLDEVLTNALSYINVRTDRSLVRAPSTGYHLNLFMVKTLDSVKLSSAPL